MKKPHTLQRPIDTQSVSGPGTPVAKTEVLSTHKKGRDPETTLTEEQWLAAIAVSQTDEFMAALAPWDDTPVGTEIRKRDWETLSSFFIRGKK